jgi:hypothetical protein
MPIRSILLLLMAAVTAACFDGKTQASGDGGSATAAAATATAHQLVLQGVPPTIAVIGASLAFQPSIASSGAPVSFAVAGLPRWASFDSATGMLTGTPGLEDEGLSGNITITASDGINTGSVGPFTIRVVIALAARRAANPPVIDGTPGPSAQAGQPYRFQPAVHDAAGRALSYAIVNCPVWAAFDTATGVLSGTPSAAQIGDYTQIGILVSDGTVSVALPSFTIAVSAGAAGTPPAGGTPPASPPAGTLTIGGTPQGSVAAGAAYSFQPVAGGAAGRPLSFAIVDRPVWAGFDTATGRLSGTPTAADVGAYPGIQIIVSDGTSSAALADFSIVVSAASAPDKPTLTGTPATSVVAGNPYRFIPTAADPSGASLTFSIQNAPAWAAFDTATGELSGTPTEADVGTYANIIISASDGQSSVSLPAFPISVTQSGNASVTLTWTPPTLNTNGSALTDLAGYFIYYGTSANQMNRSIRIASAGMTSYVVSNLSPGTWYFSIASFTAANVLSTSSGVASENVD